MSGTRDKRNGGVGGFTWGQWKSRCGIPGIGNREKYSGGKVQGHISAFVAQGVG